MKLYQKIVVGVNYTNSCKLALQQAHRIAQESGGELQAFHAVPTVKFSEFVDFYAIDRKDMLQGALGSLEHFVKEALGENHNVTCSVCEGIPHHELVSLANESEADLLVVATDEYTRKPQRSGNFAIKCLRFAVMPILIVRNQVDRPFARLTACIDLSESTTPVLEHTARMDFDEDQLVEIIHAVCPPWLRPPHLHYQTEVFENKEQKIQYHEILDGLLNTIKKSCLSLFQAPPEIISLEHEDPDFALIDHLESSHSELAILGRWGRGAKGLKTDILGGTAETLIRHAHCSVLVVPITM